MKLSVNEKYRKNNKYSFSPLEIEKIEEELYSFIPKEFHEARKGNWNIRKDVTLPSDILVKTFLQFFFDYERWKGSILLNVDISKTHVDVPEGCDLFVFYARWLWKAYFLEPKSSVDSSTIIKKTVGIAIIDYCYEFIITPDLRNGNSPYLKAHNCRGTWKLTSTQYILKSLREDCTPFCQYDQPYFSYGKLHGSENDETVYPLKKGVGQLRKFGFNFEELFKQIKTDPSICFDSMFLCPDWDGIGFTITFNTTVESDDEYRDSLKLFFNQFKGIPKYLSRPISLGPILAPAFKDYYFEASRVFDNNSIK